MPNGWYGGFKKADSQQMVKEYIAKYGGTRSDINADVAEAYSVGQVMAQAVQATHGIDQQKIISYLHSGVDAQQRAGAREVRLAGREHRREDTDLPVAERQLVQTLPTTTAGSTSLLSTPSPPGQADRVRRGAQDRVIHANCSRRSSMGY